MAGRYVCNLIHFVWATAGRREWISESWSDRLYGFLGGVARNKGCSLIAAGGVSDHVHLLISMSPTLSISTLVNALKANSSRWIHEEFSDMKPFKWQEGYGAFSVSRSSETAVVKYIRNQQEHHRKTSFQDEFMELLRRHKVEYDERYIWE